MAQDPNSGEHTDGGFDWRTLIGPGAAIGGGLLGRALTPSPQQATQAAMPPELRQLLAMSAQRAQYQNPLFQAVSQQAFQGLPNYARQGLSMGNQLPPMPQASAGSGGGGFSLPSALAGAGIGSLLRSLGNGSGGDLGKLVNALKHIFHRGGGGPGTTDWAGPTWDFNDWTNTTDTFNPERDPWGSPDWNNLPGQTSGPSWPETGDPFGAPDWGNLPGAGDVGGGGSGGDYGWDY